MTPRPHGPEHVEALAEARGVLAEAQRWLPPFYAERNTEAWEQALAVAVKARMLLGYETGEPLASQSPESAAPVGGTGQEPWSAGTREAVRAALLPYLSVACSDCGGSGEARDSQSACRFCSGTGAKRGLSAVIDEAVDAALAGVGGTGVRLTDEQAADLDLAKSECEGIASASPDAEEVVADFQEMAANAHRALMRLSNALPRGAASVGEGHEDG